ncbi:MAG: Nudix family hydrolase [Gammaproteobacteria bacterium]|nr:Nudix family hydrolase [Gammaproteobacteria bacterium]
MTKEVVHVAAAAIVNDFNEVLISQRAHDAHQGSLWEFPGGKIEHGESVHQALLRELHEEIDIHVDSCRPLIKVKHEYADKTVLLDVWKVNSFTGKITGKEGQAIRWQAVDQLSHSEFPAADVPVIRALNLPESYLITGKFDSIHDFEQRFGTAIDNGIRLAQLRLTHDWLQENNKKTASQIINLAINLCRQSGVRLLFNIPEEISTEITSSSLHLNSHKLSQYTSRPDCDALCVSCHTKEDLIEAQHLGADFMVLSPVQATATHPDVIPLGWDKFSEMIAEINVPVYALGGVSPGDLEKAWLAGAQGISAIGALWNLP